MNLDIIVEKSIYKLLIYNFIIFPPKLSLTLKSILLQRYKIKLPKASDFCCFKTYTLYIIGYQYNSLT